MPLQFFGGKVLFDQPQNFVEFDSEILNTKISEADSKLMAVLLPQANQLVENLFARPDLVNQVRMLIMGELDSGRMDSDTVARLPVPQPISLSIISYPPIDIWIRRLSRLYVEFERGQRNETIQVVTNSVVVYD